MKLKCYWCGAVFDDEEAGERFAEPEDGVQRGTMLMTCPDCGSAELEEVWEDE